MEVTLYNSFHNCNTKVKKVSTCNDRKFISDKIYRAARKRVCRNKDCFCTNNDVWQVDGIRCGVQVYNGKGQFAYELVI